MKKKEYVLPITVGLSVVAMVFAIYIGSTLGNKVKLDLTQGRLYSLSEGSINILQKLSSPVTLKLYYSKTAAGSGSEQLRQFNNYAEFIKDLLSEFSRYSRNNIKLEVIDPRPDTKEEEDAIYYGLKHFRLSETEKYFFGLVAINDTGSDKTIPFFDPQNQQTLEYDLTHLVYSVTHPQKKKVGVVSSLEVYQEENNPYMAQMLRMQGKEVSETWTIFQILKDLYDIQKVDLNADKISGIDILLIIHPKNFPEKLQFAIDQYVLTGGKVLLLVDPHATMETDAAAQMGMMMGGSNMQQMDKSSHLNGLMKVWGVEMLEHEFVGDKNLAGMARMSESGPTMRLLPVVNCDATCAKVGQDIIAANLKNTVFLFPGVLKKLDDKNPQVTPILTTTEQGNSYHADFFELQDHENLMRKFQEGKSPVTFAVKIKGRFKTAFPEGIMVEEVQKEEGGEKDMKSVANMAKDNKDNNENKVSSKKKIEGIKESTKEAGIIVIADVDFIYNQYAFKKSIFGVAQANENPVLFLNALENLTGSTDLISIRSNKGFKRSFAVIDDIERKSQEQTADKVAQINASIEGFQKELNELGYKGNEQNLSLIESKGIEKRKELARKIASLKQDLREVKREGREKVEFIGKVLQVINTALVPFILLGAGLWVYWRRIHKRKQYRVLSHQAF